jgi:hypothetical protein
MAVCAAIMILNGPRHKSKKIDSGPLLDTLLGPNQKYPIRPRKTKKGVSTLSGIRNRNSLFRDVPVYTARMTTQCMHETTKSNAFQSSQHLF